QANVHYFDTILRLGDLLQRLSPRAAAGQQAPAEFLAGVVHLLGIRADKVLQLSLTDGGAQLAGDLLAEDRLRPRWRADAADERVHPAGTGDAPADVGVECQRAIDGLALRIARQQFRPRQVEILQAAVETLHRLDWPGPFAVQAGLLVVAAVVGRQRPAELRQVNELGVVHGEETHRGDDKHREEGENKEKFPAHTGLNSRRAGY